MCLVLQGRKAPKLQGRPLWFFSEFDFEHMGPSSNLWNPGVYCFERVLILHSSESFVRKQKVEVRKYVILSCWTSKKYTMICVWRWSFLSLAFTLSHSLQSLSFIWYWFGFSLGRKRWNKAYCTKHFLGKSLQKKNVDAGQECDLKVTVFARVMEKSETKESLCNREKQLTLSSHWSPKQHDLRSKAEASLLQVKGEAFCKPCFSQLDYKVNT